METVTFRSITLAHTWNFVHSKTKFSTLRDLIFPFLSSHSIIIRPYHIWFHIITINLTIFDMPHITTYDIVTFDIVTFDLAFTCLFYKILPSFYRLKFDLPNLALPNSILPHLFTMCKVIIALVISAFLWQQKVLSKMCGQILLYFFTFFTCWFFNFMECPTIGSFVSKPDVPKTSFIHPTFLDL